MMRMSPERKSDLAFWGGILSTVAMSGILFMASYAGRVEVPGRTPLKRTTEDFELQYYGQYGAGDWYTARAGTQRFDARRLTIDLKNKGCINAELVPTQYDARRELPEALVRIRSNIALNCRPLRD